MKASDLPDIRPILVENLTQSLMASSGKTREEIEPDVQELLDLAERLGRELRESREP